MLINVVRHFSISAGNNSCRRSKKSQPLPKTPLKYSCKIFCRHTLVSLFLCLFTSLLIECISFSCISWDLYEPANERWTLLWGIRKCCSYVCNNHKLWCTHRRIGWYREEYFKYFESYYLRFWREASLTNGTIAFGENQSVWVDLHGCLWPGSRTQWFGHILDLLQFTKSTRFHSFEWATKLE